LTAELRKAEVAVYLVFSRVADHASVDERRLTTRPSVFVGARKREVVAIWGRMMGTIRMKMADSADETRDKSVGTTVASLACPFWQLANGAGTSQSV